MKKVGLTGGIGSGKTIVSKVFSSLGVPVYNADERAKELMNFDIEIIKKFKNIFGEKIYSDNKLNRKTLAGIIFNNKHKLTEVNNIVHPAVMKDFKKWCNKQSSKYILKEAAILFESKTYKNLDFIITVSAPENIRIQRVIARDHVSSSDVKNRIKNQLSDKEKIKMSDYVIINDNQSLILPQILLIHNQLINI